jgi:quercetin dioxygenase-like cupin family protein
MDALNLVEAGEEQLEKARAADSGRATMRVDQGPGARFRQVLVALATDRALADHENPGEATLQVLRGQVRLKWGRESVVAESGEVVTIPPERHSLHALEDSVVLLTVSHGRVEP